MAVSSTVSPGIVLQDGQTVTISDLNKLGTPTVSIDGAVGTLSLTDGSVTNAKVASAAGIQLDKIQSGSAAQLVVANSSGVPTYVALSGDATISDAGALTLAADSVETAEITDLNVTTAKIADDAVTAAKLADISPSSSGSYEKADITVDAQGRVTAAASNTTHPTMRVEGFTGDDNWVSPPGVTRAKFTIVGGGGGGDAGDQGGGSGSTVIASVAVTPSTAYLVTIGAGGTAGVTGTGGTSSVVIGATTYSAGGGTNGGGGGTPGANGDIKLDGQDGQSTASQNEAPAPIVSYYGTGGSAPTSGPGARAGQPGIVLVEWME